MSNVKYNRKKPALKDIEIKARSEKIKYNIILALIVVYTFALFIKAINYNFVNWDDDSYIIGNFLIRDISFHGLKNIFHTPVLGMYNPLAFVVYGFLYNFWGLNPMAYHLANILLHLVVVVLTFKFIYQLTTTYTTALIAALLFAIHPMHVTTVVWISETKTELFSIFYLLALIRYLKYVRSNYQVKFLVYAGLFFLASLLCKPSAVTLAPVLFLLDYYIGRKMDKRLLLEKIPFFLLSIFFGVLTLMTHLKIGDSIFDTNQDYTLVNNLLVSNYSIVFYLNKVLFPFNLCTIYPYPDDDAILPFKYYISILTIPFIVWLIMESGKFRKDLLFGILFFVISISVMLRIVPTGFFRASNVYTYLPYTGLFFIVAQFCTYVIKGQLSYSRKIKKYVILFLVFLFVLFSVSTSQRISVWKDSITLFNDIINKKPTFAIAYNSRGVSKMQVGDMRGAIDDFTKAVDLDTTYEEAFNNRGRILSDMKEYDNALVDLNRAIVLDSTAGEAYNNRGNIKYYRQQYDDALSDYNLAIKFNPEMFMAYKNRSMVRVRQKDTTAALKDLNKALALNPDYADAYVNRGNIESFQSNFNNALKDYSKAIELNPGNANAYNNRAVVKLKLGDTAGSKEDLNMSVSLSNVKTSIN